jgi:hypothetical protein
MRHPDPVMTTVGDVAWKGRMRPRPKVLFKKKARRRKTAAKAMLSSKSANSAKTAKRTVSLV